MIVIFEDTEHCNIGKMKVFDSAWQIDIDSVYVICYNYDFITFDNNYKIYTFNPYIDYAPRPWISMMTMYSNTVGSTGIFIYARDYLRGK